MECVQIEEVLVEFVTMDLPPSHAEAVMDHLSTCSRCRTETYTLKDLWERLGAWEVEEEPPALAESVRAYILQDLKASRRAAARRAVLQGVKGFFVPVLLGLLAAMVSAGVMAVQVPSGFFTPAELLNCGILWAGGYIAAFWLLLGGREEGEAGERLRALRLPALMGLLAMALCLVIGQTCSLTTAMEFCRTQPWTQGLMAQLDTQAAFFVFGSLYALLPLLLTSLLFKVKGVAAVRPIGQGVLGGAIYLALLLPAIHLQCGAFTMGVAFSWMGGAAVGSLLGGLVGGWIGLRPAASLA